MLLVGDSLPHKDGALHASEPEKEKGEALPASVDCGESTFASVFLSPCADDSTGLQHSADGAREGKCRAEFIVIEPEYSRLEKMKSDGGADHRRDDGMGHYSCGDSYIGGEVGF